MQILALFFIGLCLFVVSGCEKELKEHPISPQLKKKLARQNDPALQAQQISGKITLEAAETESFPPEAVLFVFARSVDGQKGPPLAAKRFPLFQFPMEYSIGPADAMIEGVNFGDKVRLVARLDLDGVAGARSGDIEGEIIAAPGSKNVDIVMNMVVAQKGGNVSGTITIAEKLQNKLPPEAVLFIIVRPQGSTNNMPLAVQRLEDPKFPFKYSIGQPDVMLPDAVFEGPVAITARLDSDGNAKFSPGDVEGTRTGSSGDEKVDIVMDRLIGE